MIPSGKIVPLVACLVLALSAAPAGAHHSFEAEYDCSTPVTITGKITAMEWVSPHTWLHVRVSAPGKADRDWRIEGGTPVALNRMGLERGDLTVGLSVSVKAHQAKDRRCPQNPETHLATCQAIGGAITLEGGRLSNLDEGSRPLNNSLYNRWNATPEQLLGTMTDVCAPDPVVKRR